MMEPVITQYLIGSPVQRLDRFYALSSFITEK